MNFKKYHIVLVDDGLAEVSSINWLGIRRFLGRVPREQIHTLFY